VEKHNAKLIEILRYETDEIDTALKKASVEGRGTPQEVADRREGTVRAVFEKYFPLPYKATKGNIVDAYGNESASIDCVILRGEHPNTFDMYTKLASVILADAVYCAVEIKDSLYGDELKIGLNQIRTVKRLRLHIDRKLSEVFTVPTVIFAQKTYKDIQKLMVEIANYNYVENQVPKREQFDIIYIHKRGIIINMKAQSAVPFGKVCFECEYREKCGNRCIVFCEMAKDSLGYLFNYMIDMAHKWGSGGNYWLKPYLERLPNYPTKRMVHILG